MENNIAKTSSNRLHPLVAGAAVAVMLASLVGVAAMTGLLPSSNSNNAPQQQYDQPQQDQPQALTQQQQQQQQQQLSAQQAPQALSAPAPVRSTSVQRAQRAPAAAPAPAPVAAACSSCGEVIGVRTVRHTPSTSGVGIAGGAVVGGLLGNQIGGGTGRTLATIAGAVGGGYAGNKVEERARSTTSYVVDVHMDNGSTRSFPQNAENWRVGDQVRVINGHLEGRG